VGAHNALHCFFPIIFFMHVGKVDAYYSYVSAFVFGYFLFSVSSFYYFLIPFLGVCEGGGSGGEGSALHCFFFSCKLGVGGWLGVHITRQRWV